MRKFYALFLALSLHSFVSHAQFSGNYAPGNWTLTLPPPSNGSINTSSAPTSIILTGSDGENAPDVDTDYTITTTSAGVWGFSWSYHTDDGPGFDPAGVLINGVFTTLTNDNGSNDQNGTYTGAFVPAGTVIGFRVRATDNIVGFATLTISNFSAPASTLPVTLVSFTAQPYQNAVKLDWRTATEENSDRFEVQRSANGSNYQAIATIAAQQNTTVAKNYTLLDPAPLNGTSYYRLRMIDRDDTYSFSPVATVKRAAATGLQLYPNPVSDQLTIHYPHNTVPQTVQLLHLGGAVLERGTFMSTYTIDMRGYTPGSYIVQIINSLSGEKEQRLILKL